MKSFERRIRRLEEQDGEHRWSYVVHGRWERDGVEHEAWLVDGELHDADPELNGAYVYHVGGVDLASL